MRFNKQELITLAALPSNKFDKEGILHITEKQEGFFRRTEVSFARWCKLRGNLLFYLKDEDQFSSPLGLIVLENCSVVIRNVKRDIDGFAFYLEFQDGLTQRLSTNTELERTDWMQLIGMASFLQLNKELKTLRERIKSKINGCVLETINTSDIRSPPGKITEILEIPICESAISCDNLLCDGHGRPPNPAIVVQVKNESQFGWVNYGRTEIIEQCSNPQFLCTLSFRGSCGLSTKTVIRFIVYDVREKLSQTSVPLGFAEIALGVMQDTTRLRIPLKSTLGNPGFITIASWSAENDKKITRSPAKIIEQQNLGHRRSQSLPPKLGVKLFVPPQSKLPLVFSNATIHTYRFHSGLGGDISVQEIMMESRFCYIIPQQLLSIWILREKELLQEISGMGELGGEWRNKQMDLLDKHLKLLKDYSQAKQNLQHYINNNDKFYKPSANKTDESLEFVPINLHLQRMWAHNETLKRSGVLDVITVGAFTKHTGKSKTGGLIKILQQTKDSPSKIDQSGCKVQAANDAVQAIKQLRKEIVEIMSQLLCLAKSKNTKGMLPLCNEMINKTRTLLNLWEPNLVEEAFEFIEKHRILDEPDNRLMPLSPFKKITQQLGALNLTSPDLEDFATPLDVAPDLWPKTGIQSPNIKVQNIRMKSPSTADINTISSIQNTVELYTKQSQIQAKSMLNNESDTVLSHSLPVTLSLNDERNNTACLGAQDENGLKFNETHFDISGEISTNNNTLQQRFDKLNQNEVLMQENILKGSDEDESEIGTDEILSQSKNEILQHSGDFYENEYIATNCSIILGYNGAFLDTKVMSSSPSANYYRPTEEPEPLDLTQLNIEASVMCLVSKVKFLCGRCGSPAVRLRQPKSSMKRSFKSSTPDVVDIQPTSNAQTSIDAVRQANRVPTPLQTMHKNQNEQTSENGQFGMRRQSNLTNKDLNLALNEAIGEVKKRVKKGNKFTDGLDLSLTTDWASELRPSMRKLRQAMDGLLKTARLMHSVQRLQQNMKKISSNLTIMYRRDVCFSQALTSLISSLMAKLWGTNITENYLEILIQLGPLAYFEGLLSLYGNETDMWGDMCIAVEDLSAVNFTLIRSNIQRDTKMVPIPRILGSRQALTILLPVPESVYCIIPARKSITFKVTPVFFNIGINEKATLSESLGYTREQHRSNWDNFDRLKQYYIRFKKINFIPPETSTKTEQTIPVGVIGDYLNLMEEQLRANISKNVKILHIAEDTCRAMFGLRFTSCKSAKDRTGMAVTLEQCRILQQEFHLPSSSVSTVLNTMRSEGTRMDNIFKNIKKQKFAFNLPQVLSMPALYRPPPGSYGKAQS